jgi:dTDP-4-dehydrorhamnose reductase
MVNDQRGSPTYAKDLSRAISVSVENGLNGILHITNSGCCTWFEFAQKILVLIGSPVRLIPVSSSQSGRAARRPHNSVLSCEKLMKKTGLMMPIGKMLYSDVQNHGFLIFREVLEAAMAAFAPLFKLKPALAGGDAFFLRS